MPLIAPSILSADHGCLAREIQALEAAGADWIHIDIMDGSFVPNLTFGPWIAELARRLTRLPLDVHLMVSDPLTYGPVFARAGADYVTVHAEACPHLHRALAAIREAGAKPGAVLNPLTPLVFLEECLHMIDLAVLMGVNPGWPGQAFIPETPARTARLAEIIKSRNLSVLVEIDGGVTDLTAPALAESGADILVSGSWLFRSPDYAAAISTLRKNPPVR
ncbi:MAG: ribulose-phosphate 3-epimerase [Deltaproteobacteria bacterium]|jgi:ribulose-phosphate 3-epimerase|nr:ribulose-phosphate 3-epimerase [Deltaproteobacteria bacterium]